MIPRTAPAGRTPLPSDRGGGCPGSVSGLSFLTPQSGASRMPTAVRAIPRASPLPCVRACRLCRVVTHTRGPMIEFLQVSALVIPIVAGVLLGMVRLGWELAK
jgi:hypothetical protein